MNPVVPIPTPVPIHPATQQRCLDALLNSHALEHRIIAAVKTGDVTTAKMLLQQQIQTLVTVLALL